MGDFLRSKGAHAVQEASPTLCLFHQALSLGITIQPSRRVGIIVQGPPGTEEAAIALYRDRVHIRAILDGEPCACDHVSPVTAPSPTDGSIDEPYRFGQLVCLVNPFPFTRDEYRRLAALKARQRTDR